MLFISPRVGLALVLCATFCAVALAPTASAQSDRPAADASADTVDVEMPALRNELLAMEKADQAIRQKFIALVQESDGQPPMNEFLPLKTRMDSIDTANMERVRAIIDQHGFPTPSMVGADGVSAAFLIIQHAPLETREDMLPLVEASYRKGHLSGQSYALLTDRVRVRNGEPQLYGTQFTMQNGTLNVEPIADSSEVDARRAELDLMPLDEYLDLVREQYRENAE